MTRKMKLFFVGVVAFYIACFVTVICLAITDNITALDIFGITLGIVGIVLGFLFLIYLVWAFPWRVKEKT